jgi:hypothetical protein
MSQTPPVSETLLGHRSENAGQSREVVTKTHLKINVSNLGK